MRYLDTHCAVTMITTVRMKRVTDRRSIFYAHRMGLCRITRVWTASLPVTNRCISLSIRV